MVANVSPTCAHKHAHKPLPPTSKGWSDIALDRDRCINGVASRSAAPDEEGEDGSHHETDGGRIEPRQRLAVDGLLAEGPPEGKDTVDEEKTRPEEPKPADGGAEGESAGVGTGRRACIGHFNCKL